MPTIKDLVSKSEKSTETQRPDHKGKTVESGSENHKRETQNHIVSEELPTSSLNTREQKIVDTLELKKELVDVFIGNTQNGENPIMTALRHTAPKTVIDKIKSMMTHIDPEAAKKIDENAFGSTARTAQAFFGKPYHALSAIKKDFVDNHAGMMPFNIEERAKAAISRIPLKAAFNVKINMLIQEVPGVYEDMLDKYITCLNFVESVENANIGWSSEYDEILDLFFAYADTAKQLYTFSEYINVDPIKDSSVVINKRNLTILPPGLFSICVQRKLQKLEIQGTRVAVIPAQIELLQNLKYFKFMGPIPFQQGSPVLYKLPEELYKLKNLEDLIIVNTHITALSEDLGNLQNLKKLDLSSNAELEFLPTSIWALPNLQELNLSGTGISSLPKDIVKLTNLKTLNLPLEWDELLPEQQQWLLDLKANGCKITTPAGFSIPE